MRSEVDKRIEVWTVAGLLDQQTADRLRTYETEHQKQSRWMTIIAVSLGGVMLGAGILLFVAAHWDKLSPSERFSLVLAMVAAFHCAASFFNEDSESLRITLHGLGTLALGAGIFLSAQIFNLQEHWPGGILLWAIGALLGWLTLRDWVQATLLALLAPAWMFSEFAERTRHFVSSPRLLSMGIAALALVYFTSVFDAEPTPLRRALRWVGGIGLLPAFVVLFDSHEFFWRSHYHYGSLGFRAFCYLLWLGLPFMISYVFRRRFDPWTTGILGWLGVMSYLSALRWETVSYLWSAIGSIALIGWGLAEHRRERINMGVAAFAITILAFYFSNVMDKLGRSFALMLFGVVFLVGGWLLETIRRQLVARIKQAQP
jgi:uncharacterized membrane protein